MHESESGVRCDTPTVVRLVRDCGGPGGDGKAGPSAAWHSVQMALSVHLSAAEHEQLVRDVDALGLPNVEAGVSLALRLLHRHAEDEAARASMGEDVAAWYAAHPDATPTSALAALYDAP